ncbi:hypothetical protein CKO40_06965 [Halochromatium glycolicum]|uniref:Uncharacterized protein n=2 Tax=Halochromatium glycolicum TaxID=85075 RepID=A0AAJ0U2X7_9GAMM|nr:hypothetical protein [Halochromatium glycolicum]
MAISYVVPGIISPIRQRNSMSCWAAMFTMMYSWQHKTSVPVETAVATLGQHYLDVYRRNTGLSIADNRNLARAAGIIAEPLQNWSIEGWASLLRRHGLLWTSYAWQTSSRRGRHIIIFYGLQHDTRRGQLVLYIDPSDGARHQMPFSRAVAQHELGFTITPLSDALLGQFSQVIHY